MISGCYDSSGNLRVIDAENSETCTMSEDAISWQANPAEVAYVGTTSGGVLDTTYSKNVTDLSIVEDAQAPDWTEDGSTLCVEVPFTPRFAKAYSKVANNADQDVYRVTQSSTVATFINTVCGPGFNVMLPVPDGWGIPREDFQIMIHE